MLNRKSFIEWLNGTYSTILFNFPRYKLFLFLYIFLVVETLTIIQFQSIRRNLSIITLYALFFLLQIFLLYFIRVKLLLPNQNKIMEFFLKAKLTTGPKPKTAEEAVEMAEGTIILFYLLSLVFIPAYHLGNL